MYRSMYTYIHYKINDGIIKYHFMHSNNTYLNYRDFIVLLRSRDKDFLKILIKALNDATFKLSAYFWECAPILNELIDDKPFEFVVIKSKESNNIRQDFSSFKKNLVKSRDKNVCNFLNLGKDAMLIIPIPQIDDYNELRDYKNISNFTKNAPIKQQCLFWKKVADELSKHLDKPNHGLWLSTHGLGVHYLHVRIDFTPKYYSFGEYRRIDYSSIGHGRININEYKKKVKDNKKDYDDIETYKKVEENNMKVYSDYGSEEYKAEENIGVWKKGVYFVIIYSLFMFLLCIGFHTNSLKKRQSKKKRRLRNLDKRRKIYEVYQQIPLSKRRRIQRRA